MKKNNVDEWRARIAAWKASGLSGQKFAQKNGFSHQSLYAWARRLRGDAPGEIQLVKLRLRSEAPEPESFPLAVELVSGRKILVRGQFSPALLSALVTVLEGSS